MRKMVLPHAAPSCVKIPNRSNRSINGALTTFGRFEKRVFDKRSPDIGETEGAQNFFSNPVAVVSLASSLAQKTRAHL